MSGKRDITVYTDLIMERIHAVREFVPSREQFFNDRKTRLAALKALQELFGATIRCPQEVRDRRPVIDRSDYASLRNVITHNYFTLNLERIREAIEKDLPILQAFCLEIAAGERQ